MTPLRTIGLVLTLIFVGLLALFFVQNSARTVDLSYDLHLWAWHFKQPQPVVLLLAGAFGGGLLAGLLLPPLWRLRGSGGSSTLGASGRGDDAWA